MRALLALALLLAVVPAAAAQGSHLLVVSGLGGEARYSEAFQAWALSMADAARTRYGLPAENVTVLVEKPDAAAGRVAGRSTREGVLAALRGIAERAGPRDAVLVLLIGHGSSDGEQSRLNLPGPDLTAADLAEALRALGSRRVAVVNAASASGGFIERLSGPNRAIVTATQSPFERNETVFGRFFVEAFAGEGADVDKDGRISVLEAFEYARREVERSYREENRLQTEHALLDDDGDGRGSREPAGREGEGRLARALYLSAGSPAPTAATPEVRRLLEEQRRLEEAIEALKARREGMQATEYQRELEALLLELARVSQRIREAGGGR